MNIHRCLLSFLIIFSICAASSLNSHDTAFAWEFNKLGFGTVADHLDITKNTKFHVKEYLTANQGAEVVWTGKVVDVIGGRNRAKILVANDERRLIKGYNIVLMIYTDLQKAAALQKGELIRFKGYLDDFKAGRHGGVIIYLRDVELF